MIELSGAVSCRWASTTSASTSKRRRCSSGRSAPAWLGVHVAAIATHACMHSAHLCDRPLCRSLHHQYCFGRSMLTSTLQLPIDAVCLPAGWTYAPTRAAQPAAAPRNTLVAVAPAQAVLGKPVDFPSFGWDNEYGRKEVRLLPTAIARVRPLAMVASISGVADVNRLALRFLFTVSASRRHCPSDRFRTVQVDVPAFEASKYLVSNAEFLPFVLAGGYKNKRWCRLRSSNALTAMGAHSHLHARPPASRVRLSSRRQACTRRAHAHAQVDRRGWRRRGLAMGELPQRDAPVVLGGHDQDARVLRWQCRQPVPEGRRARGRGHWRPVHVRRGTYRRE